MISIRVSEDDYLLLKDRYELHGNRSVSALAREALSNVIQRPVLPPIDLEAEVRLLHNKVAVLQREVSRLARIVEEQDLDKAAV